MDSEKLEDLVEESEPVEVKNPNFVLVENNPTDDGEDLLIDEDYEVEEAEAQENKKFVRTSRIAWGVLTAISAILLCCIIYMKYIMWNPGERDLCDDNIYKGTSLAISPDELDEITATMEKTLGITIEDEFKDEYALLYAVTQNDCLTEEEKNVFYGFIHTQILNHQYKGHLRSNPRSDRQI